MVKCDKCDYEWQSRLDAAPKSCPRCKTRLDKYYIPKERMCVCGGDLTLTNGIDPHRKCEGYIGEFPEDIQSKLRNQELTYADFLTNTGHHEQFADDCKECNGIPPSQVTKHYWIKAVKPGKQKAAKNPGKWLIFVDKQHLDSTWKTIMKATLEGKLGPASKTATARKNPHSKTEQAAVICVYTDDWKDEADVMRVRAELTKVGVVHKIPYKADEDTLNGKYSAPGGQRISKYFL